LGFNIREAKLQTDSDSPGEAPISEDAHGMESLPSAEALTEDAESTQATTEPSGTPEFEWIDEE
jgi:hypothetical protein